MAVFTNIWRRVAGEMLPGADVIDVTHCKGCASPNWHGSCCTTCIYAKEPVMQTSQPSPFARDHTFFGVCEALGEDLGFNPVFLRIAFAIGLFLNPVAALALYAGLGLLVAFTRFVAPNPRPAVATRAEDAPVAAERVEAEPEMALAA